MLGGGTITVPTKRLDENVKISASNTETGIKPEYIGKVSYRYEWPDKNIPKNYGVTGLILAISKQLVGSYGNEIGVESLSDEGTTFGLPIENKKITNKI